MARNSENIAGAISAVNGIVSAQTKALAQIKTALASKAAGASNGGWTKIGELTMGGTTFPISAYADGVITVTPQDGVYPTTSETTVHTRIARKADYSDYILIWLCATDTAGQFTMKNLDNQTYAPTDKDLTQYIIEEPDAELLTFSSVAPYVYHKVRATMPLMACHGMRASFTGTYAYAPLHVSNVYAYVLGKTGCEVNFETCSSYSADKLATKASWISTTANSGTWDYLQVTNKPTLPPTSLTFLVESAMLSIGTRVELWGRNNEN